MLTPVPFTANSPFFSKSWRPSFGSSKRRNQFDRYELTNFNQTANLGLPLLLHVIFRLHQKKNQRIHTCK